MFYKTAGYTLVKSPLGTSVYLNELASSAKFPHNPHTSLYTKAIVIGK